MSATLSSVMLGAVAMASFVAALFFLRFWSQTRDSLFLYFSIAFAIDGLMRLLLGLTDMAAEEEPRFYLARLLTFVLIIVGIVQKNRRRQSAQR
jgi:uncharacterized membrane protein